ncbi:uncharacterized protein EV420DRAFT_1474629 [Desarmillaria tabescens]|uniref:Uncharacterized protein n=1 Tax=Armillaria tabescens TaxID=1929756 RepID=A0AA39NKJ9_ARMTA|nr:uncharacterized protein EV420DRAFT_1474629 [Desarmillaria tabescens]KAK0467297.1 hypothetical protein EV420DRAFT_1474629 [Desarmillaria tabescens]
MNHSLGVDVKQKGASAPKTRPIAQRREHQCGGIFRRWGDRTTTRAEEAVTSEENEQTLKKLMSKLEEKHSAFKHAYIPRKPDDVYMIQTLLLATMRARFILQVK